MFMMPQPNRGQQGGIGQQPFGGSANNQNSMLQGAFGQFQAGSYRPQPNNFTFQQQPQMPQGGMQAMQSAHQQMQAAKGIGSAIADMQTMYGRGDNNIGAAIASMAAPQNLQAVYNQFRGGTYNPPPNNFAFQQQTQMPQGGMQALQATHQQMQQAHLAATREKQRQQIRPINSFGNKPARTAAAPMPNNAKNLSRVIAQPLRRSK